MTLTATPATGSVNTTVQCTTAALVGDGSARLIDFTFGGVRLITHEYEVAELFCEPDTARTWNLCEPAASPEYDLELGRVVPQSLKLEPSSEHWNFVIACESVNSAPPRASSFRKGAERLPMT